MATLDLNSQTLAETYGFGKISLTLVFHRGKVSEVYFNDEIDALLYDIGYETSYEIGTQTFRTN